MIRLARFAGTARKFVSDNSPAILTAAAVVGVVSTAVLAAKAAPQAYIDIENEKSERVDEVDLLDKVLLTYKHFVPAVVTAGATIACIIGANTVNSKRHAALASAVGLSEYAFKEYREKVIEQIGENKELKVHDAVMQDRVDRTPVHDNQVIITGNGTSLFLDEFSERYFDSDMESVRRAVNDINERIFAHDYASLNDFYNLLGIKASKVGDEVGWTTTNKLDIRYTSTIAENGRPCIVLNYSKNPVRNFDRFG